MSLLKRQFVCDRLRLQRRTSYRVIGASRLSLVSSEDVLDLLNGSRCGGMDELPCIPDDLRTPEEMAEEIGGITAKDLLNWTRRTKNVPPHFRLNSHTIRFSARRLMAWVEERSRVCRKRVA